jgi:hypothetical protein
MKIPGSILISTACLVSMGFVSAQGKRPVPMGGPQDTERCTCVAEGANCLFGDAGGCSVSCPAGNCDCNGASCRLGFPVGSHCRCVQQVFP